MNYNSKGHSVYMLTYHVVFVVKYRRGVLSSDMLNTLKTAYEQLLRANGGELVEFNGELDHVHILLSLPPDVAPATIINVLKTQGSRKLRTLYKEEISKQLWKDSLWTPSYFITTTGGVGIDVIKEYIQNQGIPKTTRNYEYSGKYTGQYAKYKKK